MTTVQISLLIAASFCAWGAMCWLDFKYQFSFVAWMNGDCDTPFKQKNVGAHTKKPLNANASSKDAEIAELKERIQILEKVVSEPAYELNQKLNKL